MQSEAPIQTEADAHQGTAPVGDAMHVDEPQTNVTASQASYNNDDRIEKPEVAPTPMSLFHKLRAATQRTANNLSVGLEYSLTSAS